MTKRNCYAMALVRSMIHRTPGRYNGPELAIDLFQSAIHDIVHAIVRRLGSPDQQPVQNRAEHRIQCRVQLRLTERAVPSEQPLANWLPAHFDKLREIGAKGG